MVPRRLPIACTFLLCACATCRRTATSVAPPPGVDPPASVAQRRAPRPRPRIVLPPLDHELPPPAQAGADDGLDPEGAPCGSVRVGQDTIPLACELDDRIAGTAVAVVPRESLSPHEDRVGRAPLPARVDHRLEGTEGPVRKQGHVGSCTAFSLAAAIDHALARTGSTPGQVSALHLWSRYHQPSMLFAWDSNLGRPLASEQTWPYDPTLACRWTTALASGRFRTCHVGGAVFPSGQPVDGSLVAAADAHPYAMLTQVTTVEHPTVAMLEKILAAGQDVWFSMRIRGAALRAARSAPYVVADYDPARATGGHAMLLAGYARQRDGTYFLMHNSMGPDWGDGGYAWFHAKTLLRSLDHVYLVDAAPAPGGSHLPPGPSARPTSACPHGHPPDVVTLACAPVCPDAGPRFDGACPTADGCGEGEVNVGGSCVPAAPNTSGVDPASGVRWDCRIGGCVYTIPSGKLGCSGAECMHSCPAPRYVLTHGPRGLSCSE